MADSWGEAADFAEVLWLGLRGSDSAVRLEVSCLGLGRDVHLNPKP